MDKMQTMAKLLTIRDAWIGDWNPDSNVEKFTLTQSPYGITILAYTMISRTFSFPTIRNGLEYLGLLSPQNYTV